jgi:hypothetical protein
MPTDKPIIEYVDGVYPWFDFELVDRICQNFPSMNIIVIGPAHPDISAKNEYLEHHKNFIFLGCREYDSIPSYVRFFTYPICDDR